jgi:hypothetical protein
MTTFVFRVRNVPAALYKAMGGFATNGVNMTKLESYQLDGEFFATQFYADIEGHPEDANVKLALEELGILFPRGDDSGGLSVCTVPRGAHGAQCPAAAVKPLRAKQLAREAGLLRRDNERFNQPVAMASGGGQNNPCGMVRSAS